MDFIRVHPCSLLTNLPSSDLHHGFFASSGFPISGRAGRTPSALKRNGVRVASLDDAGTDARYRGLTGLPRTLIRPSDEQLDGLPADFPEVAVVSDLARLMVEIDARFDHLTLAQKAGWITPPDHPDRTVDQG